MGFNIGGGLLGGLLSGGIGDKLFERKEIPLKQTPDYPEAEGARKMWWETLQEQGPENMYDAIAPDWADIWEKTKQQVEQFYEGGPMAPGAIQKVYSSAARRGVQDSPAADIMASRLRVQKNQDLAGLMTEQNKQRARFGESARLNWMQGLQGLTGQQANYYYPQKEPSIFDELMKLIGPMAQTAMLAA